MVDDFCVVICLFGSCLRVVSALLEVYCVTVVGMAGDGVSSSLIEFGRGALCKVCVDG